MYLEHISLILQIQKLLSFSMTIIDTHLSDQSILLFVVICTSVLIMIIIKFIRATVPQNLQIKTK